jgi:5-methylcytosine-specific restriction endonuclease McrA
MANLKNPEYRAYARRELHRLQGGKCCYCKREFTKTGPTRLTLEHKKAKMDGGTDEMSNLAAACHHCNQHRGQQMNGARQRRANLAVEAV